MTSARSYRWAQALLSLALLWPKGGYIPADWGSGVALVLLYGAVMLAVMALWARRWRLRALSPAAAEADRSWARGPYRFVRHPLHLALLAGALGWCLVYRLPLNGLLLAALLIVVVLDVRRRDREAAAAGPHGAERLARLPALIPGLY